MGSVLSDLGAARAQMTVSLAFHILFAVAGMAMPLLMTIAEWLEMRTGDPTYGELAKRWAKGTAILFAVGAVSGTVLSFELGLLWPRFMEVAGPVVGLPFSLEAFAFFVEAIFLGFLLYGADRISKRAHLASAAVVAISGLASGVFVMAVNAWMHTPPGDFAIGAAEIDPWAAFKSASFPTQASHMAAAAYSSIAFAVLGIHAFQLKKHPESKLHLRAAEIALLVAIPSTVLQIATGDRSAKHLAREQPKKLAAAEVLFETRRSAPLAVGGWPDMEARRLPGAIHVPYALSLLAHGDPDAEVIGLDAFPEEEWPNVPLVHAAFQIMVAAGGAMLLLALMGGALWLRRRRFPRDRWFLTLATFSGPLGLIAVEAGWTVTEAGRQPWIIRGVMRTAEAVTPMPGLTVPFLAFTLLYLFLGGVVLVLLRAHVFKASGAG